MRVVAFGFHGEVGGVHGVDLHEDWELSEIAHDQAVGQGEPDHTLLLVPESVVIRARELASVFVSMDPSRHIATIGLPQTSLACVLIAIEVARLQTSQPDLDAGQLAHWAVQRSKTVRSVTWHRSLRGLHDVPPSLWLTGLFHRNGYVVSGDGIQRVPQWRGFSPERPVYTEAAPTAALEAAAGARLEQVAVPLTTRSGSDRGAAQLVQLAESPTVSAAASMCASCGTSRLGDVCYFCQHAPSPNATEGRITSIGGQL